MENIPWYGWLVIYLMYLIIVLNACFFNRKWKKEIELWERQMQSKHDLENKN
jgi:hypothetical protein